MPLSPQEAQRLPGDDAYAQVVHATEVSQANSAADRPSEEELQARLASQYSHLDLTGAQIKQLLSNKFSGEFADLNLDTGRAISNESIVRLLDNATAIVRRENEDNALLESSKPLTADGSSDEAESIDLRLEPTEGGFAPSNPVVPTVIPDSSDHTVEVGDLEIAPDSDGQASDGIKFGEKNVLYPNVGENVDALVSPIYGGIELFYLVRTPNMASPIRFVADVPEGSHLESASDGIEIVGTDGSQSSGHIYPPTASDAQGQNVPVQMTLGEGDEIEISIPHDVSKYELPILVDPAITVSDNWQDGPDGNNTRSWYHGYNYGGMSYWSWNTNASPSTLYVNRTTCYSEQGRYCWGSGTGLYAYSKPNTNYPANTWGQYSYTAPGGTNSRIISAQIGPQYMHRNNCTGASYPQMYAGLWKPSNSTWADMQTSTTGLAGVYWNLTGGAGVKSVISGVGSGASAVNIVCWRDFLTGGAYVELGDGGTAPSLSGVSIAGWSNGTTKARIAGVATDTGLGIRQVKVTAPDPDVVDANGAYGTQSWTTPVPSGSSSPCTGSSSSPCPTSLNLYAGTVAAEWHPELMPSGIQPVTVEVQNAVGTWSNPMTVNVKIDNEVPIIDFGGTMPEMADDVTSSTKDLTVTFDDGYATAGSGVASEDPTAVEDYSQYGSGMKAYSILVDGTLVKNGTITCSTQNCPASDQIELQGSQLAVGDHYILALGLDQMNQLAVKRLDYRVKVPSSSPVGTGGPIVHVTRVEDDNGVRQELDESWGVPGSPQGRTEFPDGSYQTRSTVACGSVDMEIGGNCEEYRRVTKVGVDEAEPVYDFESTSSAELGDQQLPTGAEGTMGVGSPSVSPTATGPLASVLETGQDFPGGSSGKTFKKYVLTDTEGTYTYTQEASTGLPIREAFTSPDGIVYAVIYNYDPSTYKTSDLPSTFFSPPEPAGSVDTTKVRVYEPGNVDTVEDSETGNPVDTQFVGEANNIPDVGRVCLDNVAVVDEDIGYDPDETFAPPSPDPLTPNDDLHGPSTRVVATYEKPIATATCDDVRDQARQYSTLANSLSTGSFDVISMDADSTNAQSWVTVISSDSGIPVSTPALTRSSTSLYYTSQDSPSDMPSQTQAITRFTDTSVIYEGDFDPSASLSLRAETEDMP